MRASQLIKHKDTVKKIKRGTKYALQCEGAANNSAFSMPAIERIG